MLLICPWTYLEAFVVCEGDTSTDAIVLRTLNVNEAERVLIQRALERAHQNRTRAAELLGISVRTLRNKLNAPKEGVEAD